MSDPRIVRLRELADAVSDRRMDEFTMRIPADHNRDADLVLSWAAERIAELEAAITLARTAIAKMHFGSADQFLEIALSGGKEERDPLASKCHDTAKTALSGGRGYER